MPANIGPRSTPDYASLADTGVFRAQSNGGKAYAGPRDDAFFVDLGSIFDLGGLRPFNTLHVIPLDTEAGVDGVAGYNTASIVLQVPISEVRKSTSQPVVGVWASADRRANKEISTSGKIKWSGPWVQVSRLGDPLINEVIIPRHLKDYWNGQHPSKDSQFLKYYEAPELAGLVNFLYPALADVDTTGRTDLSLILLKGVPGVNAIGLEPGGRRHAAGQHRDPARRQRGVPRRHGRCQPAGPARGPQRRPVRLPERAATGRRRDRHRAPGDRPGLWHVPQRRVRAAEQVPEQPGR